MAGRTAITVAGEAGGAIDARPDEDQDERRILDASRGIIQRLNADALEQVRKKKTIETRWFADLRLFYGKYDNDDDTEKQLEEAGRSQAFVALTRHKTNSWAARLSDFLFPTDDKNWGIKPTPLPKLVKAAMEAVAQAKQNVDAANAAQEQDPARAAQLAAQAAAFGQTVAQSQAEEEEAKKRAEAMQTAIEDQLIQSDYIAVCRDVIEDGCRLGTGILKGPITSMQTKRQWRKGEATGMFELAEDPDPMPEYRRVDPWHFFPDMSARTIADAEFTFERHLVSKSELRKQTLKLGFNRNAARRLLRDGPPVIGNEIDHIARLREITGEGEQIQDRYIMWEYNGPLEHDEIATLIRSAGDAEGARRFEETADELEEYRCIIFFVGDEVLKIIPDYPLESGETLYSVWNFEKGETSIFGYGVPHIMSDSQRAINGAWRMMMDNSGLSVGPQILIDKDRIEPQDGSYDIYPLKPWLYSSSALTSANQQGMPAPFQVFNIPNNQAQLAGIIELGRSFADEETSLPMVAQGEAGAQVQPVGTTSILTNSANVILRRVVKSWDDDLTKPTIRRAYDWNMQNHPDESIKGDMQIDARGTSVLLVKELASQNLMGIITNWTVHPVLKHFVKVRDTLVKTVQSLTIPPDDILYSQSEADTSMARDQEAQAQAAAAAQGQGAAPDNRLEIAKLENDTRRAIAESNERIKLMEFAMKENISLAAAQTQLDAIRLKTQSEERRHAADIAIEEDRAARAEERGESAAAVTGKGVG